MASNQPSNTTMSNLIVQTDDGFRKHQSRKQRRQQQKEKTAAAAAELPKPQVTATPKPLELPSVEPATTEQSPAASHANTQGNTVGGLQEMCQSRLLPLPCYTYSGTAVDDPSRRRFICTAQINGRSAQGSGPSKRQAKRAAASAMIAQMQDDCFFCPPVVPCQLDSCKTEPSGCSAAKGGTTASTQTPKHLTNPLDESNFQQLRASKRLQSAAKAGAEVDGLFSGVRNRKAGALLPSIETPSAEDGVSSSSACEQLLELSKAHRFGVKFLPGAADDANTEPSAGSGEEQQKQHRAVVKLSTMPTIVAVGNGKDAAIAREQACRAAMEYLCALTQESGASKK